LGIFLALAGLEVLILGEGVMEHYLNAVRSLL
jgi:hypothetical protein